MKPLKSAVFLAATLMLSGCENTEEKPLENKNVVEDASVEEINEYKRMIADEHAKMEARMAEGYEDNYLPMKDLRTRSTEDLQPFPTEDSDVSE